MKEYTSQLVLVRIVIHVNTVRISTKKGFHIEVGRERQRKFGLLALIRSEIVHEAEHGYV